MTAARQPACAVAAAPPSPPQAPGGDAASSAEGVASAVRSAGYGVVRGAVGEETLALLRASVASELSSPTVPTESGAPRVSLCERSSWPSGSCRRVVEAAPPAAAAAAKGAQAWAAMAKAPRLVEALDALLGAGCWELPLNGPPPREGESYVRHWYCPVCFPEGGGGDGSQGGDGGGVAAQQRLQAPGHDGCGPAWSAEEDERLAGAVAGGEGWSAVAVAVGNGRSKRQCRERWCPPWTAEEDARLRECIVQLGGKHAPQRLAQHFQRYSTRTARQVQARAALLCAQDAAAARVEALAACPPAVGSRSDRAAAAVSWTAVNRRRVAHRGWHIDIGPGFDTASPRTAEGHPYQGAILLLLLSDWAPGEGGTAIVTGSHEWVAARLRTEGDRGMPHDELSYWAQEQTFKGIMDGSLKYAYHEGAPAATSGKPRIEQIVGKAGDIAIVHPLAVHCGTTNLGQAPRLMANGMVRIAQGAFDKAGHPLLQGAGGSGAHEAVTQIGEGQPRGDERRALERCCLDGVRRAMDAPTARAPANPSLPRVSVIVPVHNAEKWLDECLASLLTQTYTGPIELSAYNDGSTDGSLAALERWAGVLRSRGGMHVVLSSDTTNGGCGFAKNRAVEQSTGQLLCFLDADDIMLPERIERQERASRRYPNALIGAAWQRMPLDATEHYARWANTLSSRQMLLQQWRETTVQMPTWFMSRATFDTTGPFIEDGVEESLAEDLQWFLRHLGNFDGDERQPSRARAVVEDGADGDRHDGSTSDPRDVALVRVGGASSPLLLYRWVASSTGMGKTSRQRLFKVRAAALERRVLSKWRDGFVIWGNGRDGRTLFGALSTEARGRVRAFVDIDAKRIGTTYENHALSGARSAPVVGPGDPRARPPCIVAVGTRRAAESSGMGELERNVASLGVVVEGTNTWYFC